ncbi:MAG: ribosome maturation factor RimM [Acidobacteriaceae bacterium]
MSPSPWVTLAHIVRPQGRRGEVIADLLTDFPEKFAERRRLFLAPANGKTEPRPVELEDFRLMYNRVVLKFSGTDSITDAETLRGLDVVIPAEERAPLDPDAAYIDDLIGCSVYDHAGGEPRLIGSIIDVDRMATASDLLVVRREDNPDLTVDIPFVKAMLLNLDVPNRRIDMRLPEGLLDLNAPAAKSSKAP